MNKLSELQSQLEVLELEDRLELVQLSTATEADGCCSNDICGNETCQPPPTN